MKLSNKTFLLRKCLLLVRFKSFLAWLIDLSFTFVCLCLVCLLCYTLELWNSTKHSCAALQTQFLFLQVATILLVKQLLQYHKFKSYITGQHLHQPQGMDRWGSPAHCMAKLSLTMRTAVVSHAFPTLPLWHCHAQTVGDGGFSNKIGYASQV